MEELSTESIHYSMLHVSQYKKIVMGSAQGVEVSGMDFRGNFNT